MWFLGIGLHWWCGSRGLAFRRRKCLVSELGVQKVVYSRPIAVQSG